MVIPGTQEKLNNKNLLAIFFLTIIYFTAAKFGLGLALLHPSASPIWAPTGITIAALVIWGPKLWPGIFLGAFFANLTTEGTILTSLGIAMGNTLEGLVGAYFVKQIGDKDTFFKPLNIFKYIVSVGLLTTFLSALVGTTTLYLGGFVPGENYRNVLTTWWLGDMGGALLIAPFILLFSKKYYQQWTLLKFVEYLICLLAISIINILIFSGKLPSGFLQPLAGFLSFPFIIWIAIRFGPRETVLAILAIFTVIVFGIVRLSTTSTLDTNQLLLTVQGYMAIIFMTVMPLAAAIYEQKKNEKSLRAQKEDYKKLIDTSPDAILVTDPEGNIKVVNQKTLELYGLTRRSEIIDKSALDFVASEDHEKTKNFLANIIQTGRVENEEYLSVKKSGKKFISQTNGSVMYDSEGKPEGLIIISRDITKKKEVEKLKSEFVSLASHQLRTPLGSMRWSLEMLINGDYGKLPNHVQEIALDVYGSLTRLIKLVNDLLDISRIEEGRIADNPQRVDLKILLKKVIRHLSPLSQKNDLKIALKQRSKVGKIFIDQGKLRDVFENLLSNAIKYTKPKGRVDVTFEKRGSFVIISFEDSGIGIPEADKKKVFTKFYRSEKSAGIETEGTGLGLFIVKSYIENWGGKIYFKSSVGKGSRFTVELPLKVKNATGNLLYTEKQENN